ncbi:MAG: hypothetical protein AAGI27_00920 [Pseudomonadota bacterium]
MKGHRRSTLARRIKVAVPIIAAALIIVVVLDSFLGTRIAVYSFVAGQGWPGDSGISYHLRREREHFDALADLMRLNTEWKAIYAGGDGLIRETCIWSGEFMSCPPTTDPTIIHHLEEAMIGGVSRFGDNLTFEIGSACRGDTVYGAALTLTEDDVEDSAQCLSSPEDDNSEVCLLSVEGHWYIMYEKFENPDFCG